MSQEGQAQQPLGFLLVRLARLRCMLPNMTRGLLAVAALVLSTGLALVQELFDLAKVADGVYAALAQAADSRSTVTPPSSSRRGRPGGRHALSAVERPRAHRQIQMSPTSRSYAVNTHFHWDHAQGNHAYPIAVPKHVAIVASEATRENLITLGMQRVKDQIEGGPQQMAKLEAAPGRRDRPAARRVADESRQQEDYLAEIRSLELTLPDLTFDKSLILHRPDRGRRAAVPGPRAHQRRRRGVPAEAARGRHRRPAARRDAVHGRLVPAGVGGDARRARRTRLRPHRRRSRRR